MGKVTKKEEKRGKSRIILIYSDGLL